MASAPNLGLSLPPISGLSLGCSCNCHIAHIMGGSERRCDHNVAESYTALFGSL